MTHRDSNPAITAKPRAAAPPLVGAGASPAALMPPFRLPGEHFAAALMWLAMGSIGLVVVAPTLARGGFLAPRAVAVTHAFTLGWITTSIFGALYQLFPVALGIGPRSVRLGHVTFWVLQGGTVALVVGAWLWQPWALAAGWVALVLAVACLSFNVLPQRRKAPRGRTIGRYVMAGHIGLGTAMLIVAVRIGQSLGWWPANRLGLLATHVHFALVGFATLTVVGVSSRLFPMFLLSRGYREWALRWIGGIVLTGLCIFSVGGIWPMKAVRMIGGFTTIGGIGLYLFQALEYFRHRARRLDPGMSYAFVALVFLAVSAGLAVLLLVRGFDANMLGAYGVVAVVGWLSILVVGMYYKIVPFLTWLHRYSGQIGKGDVPKVADLLGPATAWWALALLASGVALMGAGLAVGRPPPATVGAALITLGSGIVGLQHIRLYMTHRQPRRSKDANQ